MIYSISGTIAHQLDNKLVITNPHTQLSFELSCPQAKTFALQQSVTLLTYLHWSQEQGPSLYGFVQPQDKELFLLLISCSGIGPKLAITALEQISTSDFLNFIAQENKVAISGVKGLGAKKAEQLILQLKDKVVKILQQYPASSTQATSTWLDLQQTLTSLHYSPAEIKQTTAMLKEQTVDQNVPFELLLRKALLLLAKK